MNSGIELMKTEEAEKRLKGAPRKLGSCMNKKREMKVLTKSKTILEH